MIHCPQTVLRRNTRLGTRGNIKKVASIRGRLLVGPVLLVLIVGAVSACAPPPPDTYVALGDSYTSGPLILPQTGQPYGCLRSGKNYPSLVAPQVSSRLPLFTDVSCSGAKTDDMFAPQSVTPGPANPPQLDALSNRDGLVSLGIGGNDIGFSSIVKNCATLPMAPPCMNTYVHDGRDELSERIAAAAPKVAHVLTAIHQKAPRAKVLVVGYPTVLPETGGGCYPVIPVQPTDVAYLRLKVKELNSMLANQASSNNATYVDTATSSIGHDFCNTLDKWVEGLVPTTDAAPVHPNAKGMANTAHDVGVSARTALGSEAALSL